MKRIGLCVVAVLLPGCVVGPDFLRPKMALPEKYHRGPADATTQSIADVAWWTIFDDQQLLTLIEQALRSNLDLRIAAAQILEAQALLIGARSPIFPQIAGGLQVSRSNDNATATMGNSFLAALTLAWEIDLWGRYRRATESARATLLATEEGRRGVITSLVSGVAQAYLQIKGLRQRLEVVQLTASAQRHSLELVSLLAKQGVQSAAEVRQAESQLLTTQNQIPAIERQIGQAEHALAILLGEPPRSFDTGSDLQATGALPAIPTGLPSQLLERRPDIRQAEQLLVAANANIGVAKARFFPAISLTGTLGRASDALRGVVTSRGTNVAAVGAAANVPIFNGGGLFANYRAAQARSEQAALTYQRTVLVALQEVSDTLIAYDRDRAEALGNRDRVAVTTDSVALADLRFRSGVISYLEVLDAQRQLFAAQLDLNASELNQRLDAVQLYRALGGGWRPENKNVP